MGLKEFAEKVNSDSALAAKIQAAESLAQVVDIAKAAGYNVSLEDFEKLSDDDLDNVAGGGFFDKLKNALTKLEDIVKAIS